MKKISLREFQLHASDYIKDLPIVLTTYNKPVAMVVPHVETDVTTRRELPTPAQLATQRPDDLVHHCEANGCRGSGGRYKLTQMDSIEGESSKEMYLCDPHAQKARQVYQVTSLK